PRLVSLLLPVAQLDLEPRRLLLKLVDALVRALDLPGELLAVRLYRAQLDPSILELAGEIGRRSCAVGAAMSLELREQPRQAAVLVLDGGDLGLESPGVGGEIVALGAQPGGLDLQPLLLLPQPLDRLLLAHQPDP